MPEQHQRDKVIVVEDDDSMRESIETLLQAAGIDCAVFESAEALLTDGSVLGQASCVVSDYRLPSMSGLELLDALRARRDGVPLIMITAQDSDSLRAEAERRGAAAFLAKPFRGGELLAAIRQATEPCGSSMDRCGAD